VPNSPGDRFCGQLGATCSSYLGTSVYGQSTGLHPLQESDYAYSYYSTESDVSDDEEEDDDEEESESEEVDECIDAGHTALRCRRSYYS
jgi:hypothetical protein